MRYGITGKITICTISLLSSWLLSLVLVPRELAPLVAEGFDLQEIVPIEFSGWTVDPRIRPIQAVQDNSLADRIYDQTVSRGYRDEFGNLIMLVVVYGRNQSDALQIHRPEVCYAANGFKVSGIRRHDLALNNSIESVLPAISLDTKGINRYESVTYWTRIGDKLPLSNLRRQIHKISYGLMGRIPDGLLVRVSSISRDSEAAVESHEKFIRQLLEAIPEKYLPLFLGSLASQIRVEERKVFNKLISAETGIG